MVNFSSRQKFSAWPNPDLPPVAAGVYAVWEGDTLIYCGISGREFEKAVSAAKPKFGLGCVPKVVTGGVDDFMNARRCGRGMGGKMAINLVLWV
ncbi:hypothetical protein [Aeromonas hydrophila]|uniref:hypothetical protein n=1 Tax=Aeromonas hydrophila TaxID=644 RepID=UPI00225B2ED1|nr:hypothetical protein [Aeromonas hydrophila]MCX4116878.1 hypothetical protein [Aeromonas hydrophila]